MERNFRSIVMLLVTQAMINLGEVKDPLTNQFVFKLDGARMFIELLEILEEKTKGNLNAGEIYLMNGMLSNLKRVYIEKEGMEQSDEK